MYTDLALDLTHEGPLKNDSSEDIVMILALLNVVLN